MNQDIKARIAQLKKEKNAIILAHTYQNDEVQEIADYIGDSFMLSKIAKNTNASVIIFCGVHFMAETAKVLSPDKEVILPVSKAGCKMADTITYEALKKFKEENPDYKIVGYVNTSALVKTLCDVCVTSSNALTILKHYENEKVMYVPDKNLAIYANHLSGKSNVSYWNGCCYIHDNIKTEEALKMKEEHPEALLLVHPEAKLEVLKLADFVGSTKEMIDFVKASNKKEFIVGTESGILYSLKKDNPDKVFYPISSNMICGTMKMTSLVDVLNALEKKGNRFEVIELDQDVINKANYSLNRMLELGDK